MQIYTAYLNQHTDHNTFNRYEGEVIIKRSMIDSGRSPIYRYQFSNVYG